MKQTIALLTDFGHQDNYVGVLKGVIAGICPTARVIDLCHEVPPGDIRWGAWQLWSAYQYFPPGTVFVCVVDPGVGSSRRAIALAAGGRYFIGPDNGLLSWAVPEPEAGVILDQPRWHLSRVSMTFHGRDIFAPVAAQLVAGVSLPDLGSPLDRIQSLEWPEPVRESDGLRGEVLLWDRFGNLVSNIRAESLTGFLPESLRIEAGSWRIQGLSKNYSEAAAGQPLALIGSSGLLELSLPRADARATLQAEVGLPVRVFSAAT